MSKDSDKTQTTTTNTSQTYAPWTQAAGQNGYNTTVGMTNPFLKTPAYMVAGFNPDQTKAFDLARQMAQGAFTGTASAVPTGASMTAAQVAPQGMSGFATAAAPQNVSAAQLGATDYQQFLNPYINSVVDTTTNKARNELRRTEADIGAKYAKAGAFGGGREVLARGKAQDNFDENLQATTAQLMANGYDAATANALANTQLRQQTAENNAGRQQQTAENNAARQQQTLQNDAERRQQAALQNAEFQQVAGSTNLNYGLQAAQVAEAMRNGQTDRQNTALQQLLGLGNQQQVFAQSAMDSPWTALQRLLAATPAVYNTTGVQTDTAPDNSPGFLQQALGVGGTILGAAMPGGGSLGGTLISKVLK